MIVPCFDSFAQYVRCFNDASYWQLFVAEICRHHGLEPVRQVDAGLPGTFPAFIVDGRYVVKLYGELFGGPRSWAVELEVYGLLRGAAEIRAPALIASGRLDPAAATWSWPYLVTSVLPGTSFGSARNAMTNNNQETVVRWLGRQMRAFYALRLPESGELSPAADRWSRFLGQRYAACVENHRRWNTLPPQLLDQIEKYLPPVEALIDRATRPCLLHADLNEDHILGRFAGSTWQPSGIIDFGDVMVGEPIYDLVALHIGLGHADKHLLHTFLDAARIDGAQQGFAQRAMCYTLLHRFNVLGQVFEEYPAARRVASFSELAERLWDLGQPELRVTARR